MMIIKKSQNLKDGREHIIRPNSSEPAYESSRKQELIKRTPIYE